MKWIHDHQRKLKEWEDAKAMGKSFFARTKLGTFISKIPKPSHSSMNVRLLFEEDSIQYQRIKGVFDHLSDPSLLERCMGHYTQNANESFHSRIWNTCPKIKYSAFPMLKFAICQNILTYSLGYELGNIMKSFDINVTEDMRKFWKDSENTRKN